MRYSITDEDLKILLDTQNEISNNLKEIYQQQVADITDWSKKINSELVNSICNKTLNFINTDYISSIKKFTIHFEENESSFVKISHIYKVGPAAIQKVKKFQEILLDTILFEIPNKVNFTTSSNALYSKMYIEEYRLINQNFINRTTTDYTEKYAFVLQKKDQNLLWSSFEILIKQQYEDFIKFISLSNEIFEIFVEWYSRNLLENQEFLENYTNELRNKTTAEKNDAIDKLLSEIIDASHDSALSNSQIDQFKTNKSPLNEDKLTGDNIDAIKKNIEPLANEDVISLMKSLSEELDTPEKIKNFTELLHECINKFNNFDNEPDTSTKKSLLSAALNTVNDFFKKYHKPIIKLITLLLPILAPTLLAQTSVLAKLIQMLPQIIECFSTETPTNDDVTKIKLGLELLNLLNRNTQMNLDNSNITNTDVISKDILKTILNSSEYKRVLGLNDILQNDVASNKLYEELTGKKIETVPPRRQILDYNFDYYDPEKLKYVSPIEKKDTVEGIVQDVGNNIPKVLMKLMLDKNNDTHSISSSEKEVINTPNITSQKQDNYPITEKNINSKNYFEERNRLDSLLNKNIGNIRDINHIGHNFLEKNLEHKLDHFSKKDIFTENHIPRNNDYCNEKNKNIEYLNYVNNSIHPKNHDTDARTLESSMRNGNSNGINPIKKHSIVNDNYFYNRQTESSNNLSNNNENTDLDTYSNKDFYSSYRKDFELIKDELQSEKGYITLPNNRIEHIIEALRSISNKPLKAEILPNIDGRYNKEDVKMLFDELEYEQNIANKLSTSPDINRAFQNFIRRQMGYPAEYDRPVVKTIEELLPVIDDQPTEFSINDPDLYRTISQAHTFANSKSGKVKISIVNKALSQNILGKSSYLGLGLLLLTTSLWPIGAVTTIISLGFILSEDDANSYAQLVYKLGKERVDILLNDYNNTNDIFTSNQINSKNNIFH